MGAGWGITSWLDNLGETDESLLITALAIRTTEATSKQGSKCAERQPCNNTAISDSHHPYHCPSDITGSLPGPLYSLSAYRPRERSHCRTSEHPQQSRLADGFTCHGQGAAEDPRC